jgi:pimeloyl-ACP methyl ester carboxylesterase
VDQAESPEAILGPDVSDHRLTRPDGRVVAWSESGVAGGRPLLRVPGTPGSRFAIPADRTRWFERELRVITTERPGYGASTRLEGRRFVEHSDDLAAILDELGIEALLVAGGSGAAPHILDFAARHPDRVSAATITVGAAPIEPAEADQMIELNAREYRLIREGRLDEVWRIIEESREQILADPLAGFRAAMASATDMDRQIIDDPAWQRGFVVSIVEALRQGPGGWYDEGIAMEAPWEIDFGSITTDITWWHSDRDRNAPLSAAQRVVDALPKARLNIWADAGHLTAFRHESEILDELLARGGLVTPAVDPETIDLPVPVAPTTGTTATAAVLAERDEDGR